MNGMVVPAFRALHSRFVRTRAELALFAAAFLVRGAYVVITYTKGGTASWSDAWAYVSLAENMLVQGPFVPDLSLLRANAVGIGPGYPAMIAPLIALFDGYLPILLFNAALSALIPVVIYGGVKELAGRRFALAAGAWTLFYANHVFYVAQPLKESTVFFLCAAVFAMLVDGPRRPSLWRVALPAVTYALLVHVDERYLFYAPFVLAAVYLPFDGWARSLRRSVFFLALLVLCSVPWLVRNYAVFGRVVLVSTRTASITDRILYPGNPLDARFYYGGAGSGGAGGPGATGDDPRMRAWTLQARGYGVAPRRFGTAERLTAEFRELWRPVRFAPGFVARGFRFEKPWSTLHNAATGVTYGLLLPFFIVGTAYAVKERRRVGIIGAAFVCVHTFLHLFIVHARNRYRVPVDVVVIVFAFYGLSRVHAAVRLRWASVTCIRSNGMR